MAQDSVATIEPVAMAAKIGPEISRGSDEAARWEKKQPKDTAAESKTADEPNQADKPAPAVVPAAEAGKPGQGSFVYFVAIGLVLLLVVILIFMMRRKQA